MIGYVSKQKDKGFTLVEMLVAIALFSIVLVVILGSIITVIDINRKSQSLTVVMNDLNFSMESFTRSIKTGKVDGGWYNGCRDGCMNIIVRNQELEDIEYNLVTNSDTGFGMITRKVDGGSEISITSSQIDVQVFEVFSFSGASRQPRVMILIGGEVWTSPRISSEFKIQTSISQRDLDMANLIN